MLFAIDCFFWCVMLYNLYVSSYPVCFISHPVCSEIHFNVLGLFFGWEKGATNFFEHLVLSPTPIYICTYKVLHMISGDPFKALL